MRHVPAAVRALTIVSACVPGSTMKSFFPSVVPSSEATRAAFIISGTVLNLLSGKNPACGGRACTASGASSFSMFSRSAGDSPPAEVSPSRSSGSAPGFSSGDGGNEASGITSGIPLMPPNRFCRST